MKLQVRMDWDPICSDPLAWEINPSFYSLFWMSRGALIKKGKDGWEMLVKLGSLKNSILVFLVKSALGFSSCGGIVLLLVIWRAPPVGMPATLIKRVGRWIDLLVQLACVGELFSYWLVEPRIIREPRVLDRTAWQASYLLCGRQLPVRDLFFTSSRGIISFLKSQ